MNQRTRDGTNGSFYSKMSTRIAFKILNEIRCSMTCWFSLKLMNGRPAEHTRARTTHKNYIEEAVRTLSIDSEEPTEMTRRRDPTTLDRTGTHTRPFFSFAVSLSVSDYFWPLCNLPTSRFFSDF